jgi:mono/diheme cytochrome c family protein
VAAPDAPHALPTSCETLMKKTWLKRAGYGLLALIALAAATVAVLVAYGHLKASRKLEVRLEAVAARSDTAAVERGGYLFRSRGCTDCHGGDGAGRTFVDDGKGLRLHAPNITPAAGSATAGYRMDDWDRTIRHGVAPGGRPLMIMPSEDYNRLTNDDFAALVAYLRQMPAAEGGPAEIRLPLPVRALYGAGVIEDAAQKIDHSLPPSAPVPETVSTAHGAYVANACIGCHGPGLAGGSIPGAPPDWPAAANLTPGDSTAMAKYADAKSFVAMMRSGRRPDGSAVSPVMPFGVFKAMSDVDLEATFLHLKSLAPRAAGSR